MEELKGYRSSAQQRRVWRLRRVEREDGRAYASTCVVRVDGPVDRRALRRSLEGVVRRHESLRTRCEALRGMEWPLQVIDTAEALEWREEVVAGDIDAWLAQVWSAPCGDALQAAFGVVAPDQAWLALRMSALYVDGWSLQRLIRDLAPRYEAMVAGRESAPLEEPLQYVQFSEWQHDLRTSDEGREAQQYWARRWEQAQHTNALRPLSPAGPFRMTRQQHALSAATRTRIHRFVSTAASGVSHRAVLQAIWSSVLARHHSGAPAPLIASASDERKYAELDGVIGSLYTALPGAVTGSGSLIDAAEEQEELLEAIREWQEYFDWPEALAETYWTEGFEYQELDDAVVAGGVRFDVQALRSGNERFDRKLVVVQHADALRVEVEYDPAVHTADEIARMLDQYEVLLRAAIGAPRQALATLPWMPAKQRREVVETWNQTALAGVPDRTLVDLVEAQCQRTPDAIAVRDDTTTLTYAQLSARAAALAARLYAAGVGIESRVMVWLERSAAQLVAVLGVWKAGGAYVPVETTLPDARLHAVLADSGARVVVSDGPAPWAEARGAVVVPIEETAPDAARPVPAVRHMGLRPQHLAYVIYTSGSTGRPKGVMVPHGAVVNLAAALAATVYADPDLGAGACVSVNAPLSFDASVKQLVQLAAGRTLHVIPETVRRDGEALWRYLQAHDVTVADCTPTQLRLGLMAGVRAGVPRVLVGGEAIDADLWTELARDRATHYWNVYGPTECTVDATATRVAGSTPHLGRPLGNMRAYVLDAHQQPVPVGVWGELYIGGAGVARGYVGQPGLTAARFLPDPFGGHAGARLYRTGDWARWRSDGCLEYGGRRDQQVKLRGYRIELGEIEAVLEEHPAVPQAAVVVHGRGAHEQLVAFYRGARSTEAGPEPSTEVSAAALREWVEQRVPPYMVPAMFVRLVRWPMNANGKIDRAALATMEIAAAAAEAPGAPATPFEELLVSVWQDVLGRAVGVEENFFDRGGHSLLATQVMGRVRQTLQRDVPLRLLFEAPTVRALAAQLEPLMRGTQRALPPLVPMPRDGALPLSFAQQRLWFLAQLEPASTAYYSAKVLRLRGALDVAALEASFQDLVRRHEVLRTRFPLRGGTPVQEITAADMRLVVHDVPAGGDGDADAALESRLRPWVRAARAESFDLAEGPMLRARLLRVAADDHVLLLTIHHIVVDAWSLTVLWRELGEFYAGHRAGRPSPLPPLALQYADFAQWQRQWLQGDVLDEQLTYWRDQLAEVPELTLPTDHARPAQLTGQGARVSFTLGPELTAQLKAVSRTEGVTLFMTLLAGFQVLLARYAQQQLFAIGTPIAGRTRPEVEPLIGCFINMLALRADLRGNPTFRQLLGRVRETCLGAYGHQDFPFERLVDALQLARDLSRAPLFQVVFGFENAPATTVAFADLAVEAMQGRPETAKYDVNLIVSDGADGLSGVIEYSSDLFTAATVERMAGHFRELLTAMAASLDTPIAKVPLLTAAERLQIEQWNQTARDYAADVCLPDLLEAQAARTPDGEAVRFEGRALTYAQLHAQANRLAHALRARGVGPETLVGVCLERSLDLMVTLLAIGKAGGAFVPLDPEYPADRLAFMVANAGAPVVVTDSRVMAFPVPAGTEVIALDRAAADLAARPADAPPRADLTPNHLAYMIYTSGSTGQPKGALNTHRGVCNRLLWMQEWSALTADDRVLQKTPIGFDVSVWEFFWPLLTGATLVLARPGGHRDPDYLTALLRAERITTAHFVPSMLQAFLEAPDVERCTSLRRVICSGEALTRDLQDKFFARSTAALHNLYGPTEAAVDVTAWTCQRGGTLPSVPIGVPIANTEIHLCDRDMQPVPIGVMGELYIGGVQVGRGYCRRAALTADRFVPDPFSAVPGARLYRTGDLARYLADGTILYGGRGDHQVKVRGYRIELGEIEAVLHDHPAVHQAAVLLRTEGASPRLVAFVAVRAQDAPGVEALRAWLEARLPVYMVPVCVMVDALPLLPNGKVDRQSLLRREVQVSLTEAYVAPRTPMEGLLASIWQEVLGVPRIGVHDNFFAAGGDSILSIQVTARAKERGLPLTPREMFQHQTIAALARGMEGAPQCAADQGMVTGPVELTPIQRWFFARVTVDRHHFNQSRVVTCAPALTAAIVETAVGHLLTHHDALRMRFTEEHGTWRQVNAPVEDAAPFTAYDWTNVPDAERVSRLQTVAESLQGSLDLHTGPLLRVAYFDWGPAARARILIVVHHLVVDGVSWRFLLDDLQTVCLQLANGEQPRLPLKIDSYQRWAASLQAYGTSEALAAERGYWRAIDETATVALPIDRHDGDDTQETTAIVSLTVSREETEQLLRQLHRRSGSTVHEALLAAVGQALTQWARGAVRVDLEGHGREPVIDADVSRTVGWFTAIYPMVLRPAGASALEGLQQVAGQVRQIPHRGIGYGLCAPSVRSAPISFNYLGQQDSMWRGGVLTPAPEDSGRVRSARQRRAYLLEVSGVIRDGCLRMQWGYSRVRYHASTIEGLANAFSSALRRILAETASTAQAYTPADFPLAGLTDERLALVREAARGQALEAVYPLSPLQHGMLIYGLQHPGKGVYVEQQDRLIEGTLDADAFERAWRHVIQRHGLLRACFLWESVPQPLQVVLRELSFHCDWFDWRGMTPEDQAARWTRWLAADRARGFAGHEQPLLRVQLCRMSDHQTRMLVTNHHAILDGWSTGMVLREVWTAYDAYVAGQEPALAPSGSFEDYIAWLRRQPMDEATAFWRRVVGDLDEATATPRGDPSSALAQTPTPASASTETPAPAPAHDAVFASLPIELTQRVERMAKDHGVTLATIVQGLWGAVLGTYNGGRDAVFGVTLTTRPDAVPAIEQTVGPFINTVPVRWRWEADTPLIAALTAFQQHQADARHYGYAPLLAIHRQSGIALDRPLFDSLVVFQNFPSAPANTTLRLSHAPTPVRTMHPLTLVASHRDRQLHVRLAYDTSRVSAAAVQALLAAFTAVVDALVTEPRQRMAALLECVVWDPELTSRPQAQPALAAHAAASETQPATPMEELLVSVWQDVLGRTVGVEENFFDRGGHSLLATQVMGRVRQTLQRDVPLRLLFEAPTVRALAARLEPLLRGTQRAQPPLVPLSRDGALPLSFAQQRLWFLAQLEPASTAYNSAKVMRLRGPLDVIALEAALRELVRRHEVLRTRFPLRGGTPVQEIAAVDLRLAVEDVPAGGDRDADAALESRLRPWVRAARAEAFDLAEGPMLRARLLRVAADDHILLLAIHHIIVDAWSLGVLWREIAQLYASFRAGEPPSLPPLPVQYADFAQWQRQWLQGDVLEEQLAYWRGQLADVPELDLPTDHVRPAQLTGQGARVPFTLGPELSARIKAIGSAEGVTLFMTLLAGFQAVLGRYAQQQSFAIGTPIAGRTRPELEPLIGCFINMLALRADLRGTPTFRQLLDRVRETCLGAYAHQDLPFERLVDELQPARDLSRAPLFQTIFVLQNAPRASFTFPGLEAEGLASTPGAAKYDLNLTIADGEQGLSGVVEYATDLFEATTVERMLGHFREVLTAMTIDLDTAVAALPLLTAGERRDVVETWNQTALAGVPDGTLIDLVEAQCQRTPDAIAVRDDTTALTYAQISARAAVLAERLRAAGVGLESRVMVWLERSAAQVVAVLGVWKAGCAYVPVETTLPDARLQAVLADSGARVVVSDGPARWAAARGAVVVPIEEASEAAAPAAPPPAHPTGLRPQHLAYVIYTSGSTGRPKGVMVPHGAVVNLAAALAATVYADAGACVSVNAPLNFDSSVKQLVQLAAGRTLHVIPETVRRDGEALWRYMQAHNVSVADCTPTQLRLGLMAGVRPGVARVLVGGEAIDADLWTQLASERDTQYWNVYGPTECTVDATAARVAGPAPHIGRPLGNMRAYVLDARQQPVPAGVWGELHIGGAGVARGYVGQPALTAARFIPDPFSGPAQPGARLYRTGDWARWRADGCLEYRGRRDQQVKVRGYRIELGDIEAALQEHPAVRQAAVIVRTEGPSSRLVAYVVGHAAGEPGAEALRQWLETRVPAYMVPVCVMADALPLLTNGKVDRQTLRQWEVQAPATERYVAPRTPVEALLASIWQEVLGIAQVGVHDNFFAAGGDSILSIQVTVRAKERGLPLTPREMFQYQTIAALARGMEDTPRRQADQALVAGPVSLTPIQRRFFERVTVDRHHFNQSRMVTCDRAITPPIVEAAVTCLLTHHDALRMRFTEEHGTWRQVNAAVEEAACFTAFDWTDVPAADRASRLATMAEALQRSLDLRTGPLMRVAYVEWGPSERARILIVAHHLVVDGVSWGMLLEDLQTVCLQLAHGKPPRLPLKTDSYQRWAALLHAHAASGALADERDFWRAVDQEDTVALPVDLHDGDDTRDTSAAVAIAVSREETEQLLRHLHRRSGSTVHEALLAAVAQAVTGFSGGAVRVDLEGHGREPIVDADVSRTVGWFTAVYPMVLRPAGSALEGLQQVTGQVRQIPHRGIGYGLWRYDGDAPADAERAAAPPAPISFNYLGQQDRAWHARPFAPAAEDTGRAWSGQQRRPYLLEITGVIRDGCLRMRWSYSRARHRPSTIEGVANAFLVALRQILAETASSAQAYTPADFPLAGLTDDRLPLVLEAARGRALEAVYPISPLQHGMLMYGLQHPGKGVYVEQIDRLIEGTLDADAMERAWRYVIQRHGVLRAFFLWESVPDPLQVVLADIAFACDWHDWRDLGAEDQAARWMQWVAADRARGFAVGEAPLLRVQLCRMSDRETRMLVTNHHAILDGWSIRVVLHDVWAAYDAYLAGHEPALAPSGSFEDYIAWLRRQPLDEATAFWRSVVGDLDRATAIPRGDVMQRPAPAATPAPVHDAAVALLPVDLTQQVERLAKDQGLTLATIVQGLWGAVLGAYNGGRDAVFGVTLATRPDAVPAIEQTVGPFINTVPVRWRWDAGTPLIAALTAFQQHQADAQHYGYAPLLTIHLESAIGLDRPLFESLVVFQNYPSAPLNTTLRLSQTSTPVRTMHPVTLLVTRREQALRLRLAYDTTQVSAAAAQALLAAFEAAADALVAEPRRPMATLLDRVVWDPALAPEPVAAASPAEPETLPATPLEELLVSVWQEVLGRAVGVDESFFEHGGHSLLATQAMGRLRQTLQREIPLRLLFEAPTVRALAAKLEPLLAGARQPMPPLVAAPREGALPLSFAQQRLWFLAQLEPSSPAYNTAKVLRLHGPLDVAALEAALQEIVRRHEVLRTRFPLRGEEPVQEITSVSVSFVIDDAPPGAGDASTLESIVTAWVRAARAEPFDLAEGPVLRARLLRVAADDHVLLLTMHHIVSDAWSQGVLGRELGQLYASHRAGRPSPLPPLAVQYADYASWQRQWLQGAVLDEHLAYWRGQLAGVPELELPADRARPAQLTSQGARLQFTLGAELTAKIRAIGRAEGVTPFMTLLAAFQVLLGRYAQQELFAIGTPIAGRTRPEVEPLIGCFINMLVLRADLRGNPTFRQLLGRVRDTCLGAYAHQDLPFERLVDELQLAREATRAPLSEVTFGLQNAPRTTVTLDDLTVEPLSGSASTARHDLTLWATDAIDHLYLVWTWRPEIFDAASITVLQNAFASFLAHLVSAGTDLRIGVPGLIQFGDDEARHGVRRSNRERLLTRKA